MFCFAKVCIYFLIGLQSWKGPWGSRPHFLKKILYWSIVVYNVVFVSAVLPLDSIIHRDAAAKSLQSCPTLCDPIDGSPPGSTVPGILQARTLERVAISFSNAWKWEVKVKSLSRVRPSATPWTAAFQAPPSMGFSRQEYWSGVPSPSLIHRDISVLFFLLFSHIVYYSVE